MAWNRKDHEKQLTDLILNGDWSGIQRLADEAAAHDREVAEQTGEIFWAHEHLAS